MFWHKISIFSHFSLLKISSKWRYSLGIYSSKNIFTWNELFNLIWIWFNMTYFGFILWIQWRLDRKYKIIWNKHTMKGQMSLSARSIWYSNWLCCHWQYQWFEKSAGTYRNKITIKNKSELRFEWIKTCNNIQKTQKTTKITHLIGTLT